MKFLKIKLNTIFLFITLTLVVSCWQKKYINTDDYYKKIENEELQSILDSSQVKGALLIFDPTNNVYYSNNFKEANKGVIPASTYKIPHSIIGIETGILKNEETIFKWDGNNRALSIWEKDLSLKQAFQSSCVPCYQGLARKIGAKKMNEHLSYLNFGLMDVSNANVDNFWLVGKSKINNFQQINFLNRLYNNELTISKSTSQIVRNIIKIKENKDFILSGKTGFGIKANANIGWFVGYIEKENRVYYFSTRISPNDNSMPNNKITALRKTITFSALKRLNIIE